LFLDTHDLPDAQTLEAQLCVVGAGAAGITLALSLRSTGIDVLLLEAGGRDFEAQSQALYDGEVVDPHLHSPPDRYRQRRFGGTTTIWGGRCMPLDPLDFAARDYVPHSGWPLDLRTLLPYYTQANLLCEAGRFSYLAGEAFQRPLPPMLAGFESANFSTDTLERFSCPTDFGRRYGHTLAAARNIRVLLHANVTHLQLDANARRVTNLTVRNHAGKQFSVRAQQFVLAVGGLETARLLLASRDIQPTGIGNAHDAVGRYYMCHLAGTIGRIQVYGGLGKVWNGYDISDEGIYCRRRLALRPEMQRSQRLGNFIARLHHPRITDPAHRNAVLSLLYLAKFAIPYEYRKRLHEEDSPTLGRYASHLRNVVTSPADALSFAWHMLRDRKLAERKFPSIVIRSKAALFSLDFHAEQQPNPASRITLSDRLDPFGMPRIRIDWRYTKGDVATVSGALALLRDDLRQSGVASFDYDPDMVETEMTRFGAYGGHHIGTARMGDDPRTSVVNEQCRVHNLENLHIASAATFPTSSQANPTLTVVTLALRLAEHLRGLLQAGLRQPAPVAAAADREPDTISNSAA
jgi:choline dehydrogenase-like flavoprotein